jgi:hypothetical protein
VAAARPVSLYDVTPAGVSVTGAHVAASVERSNRYAVASATALQDRSTWLVETAVAVMVAGAVGGSGAVDKNTTSTQ